MVRDIDLFDCSQIEGEGFNPKDVRKLVTALSGLTTQGTRYHNPHLNSDSILFIGSRGNDYIDLVVRGAVDGQRLQCCVLMKKK